jgi:hypothetical protein
VSKPKARNQAASEFRDPDLGPVLSVRLVVAAVLVLGGLAWMAYYYLAVRVDPTAVPAGDPGSPAFMADLGLWNYAIGFGAVFLGLAVSAHPVTPMGRGRGVVIGMLGCFLIGLAWIVTFYLFANDLASIPVMNDLDNWNLVVGIGFMAVGFAFATRWE